MDAPQGIGLGQTISAPHMHAHVLEEMYPFLQPSIQRQQNFLPQQQQWQQQSSSSSSSSNPSSPPLPHVKMLDVGCGSGYLMAAMGQWIHNPDDHNGDPASSSSASDTILGATEQVFAIDVHAHLIDLTTRNMPKFDAD